MCGVLEGHDENDPACRREWVTFGTPGRLVGHCYIHSGDTSASLARCRAHSVQDRPVKSKTFGIIQIRMQPVTIVAEPVGRPLSGRVRISMIFGARVGI